MALGLRRHLAPHIRALIADMRQGDKVGTKPEQHHGRHLEIFKPQYKGCKGVLHHDSETL